MSKKNIYRGLVNEESFLTIKIAFICNVENDRYNNWSN